MADARRLAMFIIFQELFEDEFRENDLLEEDEPILALLVQMTQRNKRIRIGEYFESVVPMYSVTDFRNHFRMSRGTVSMLEGLLTVLPDLPQHQQHGGRAPVDLRKQILITLWVLGNTECLRSVADRFDVTRSSAYRVSRRICKAIASNLIDRFIKFPSGQEVRNTIDRFEAKQGFPGILGAVDGCHIPIKAPKKNHEQYINRKGFHSVQLQVVCDTDMQFTDVFCGYPGSVHDARVFRNCPLFHDAVANVDQLFPGNSHLIADAAYPIKSWLLPPFRNNGRLTRQQLKYNFAHSSTRMVVERSLALLKGRFRKLKTMMDIDKTEDLPEIVIAACVLHNVWLMSEEDIHDFLDGGAGREDDYDDDYDEIFPPEAAGDDKRNEIMRNLP